ncbi:ATP-binding protein [Peterkaempfera griseoplana]|uniref:ATP-binding protein n=1 Tax=Peterkaempfera griseoplana TaxID=66896 RepID=UPI0006E26B53|nr:ATP-binding protein [Peterkaempfera griseoplana]
MHSARHRARRRRADQGSDPDSGPEGDPDVGSGRDTRADDGPAGVPDCAPDRPERAAALSAARTVWPMDRQAAATLPGAPEAVSTARRFVRITAAMWRLAEDLVGDAELCISELVGNAVMHTDSHRVHCRIWSARQTLFLEVDDEGRLRLPSVAPADDEDEHGRGMLLVETFAEAWGTVPRPGLSGKTVWVALPMPTALRAS